MQLIQNYRRVFYLRMVEALLVKTRTRRAVVAMLHWLPAPRDSSTQPWASTDLCKSTGRTASPLIKTQMEVKEPLPIKTIGMDREETMVAWVVRYLPPRRAGCASLPSAARKRSAPLPQIAVSSSSRKVCRCQRAVKTSTSSTLLSRN